MTSSTGDLATPQGPGSVSGAPNLPAGFSDTFASRYVDAGEVRLHAVIGGDGPPLRTASGTRRSAANLTVSRTSAVVSATTTSAGVPAEAYVCRTRS